jgi:hypothetical protein
MAFYLSFLTLSRIFSAWSFDAGTVGMVDLGLPERKEATIVGGVCLASVGQDFDRRDPRCERWFCAKRDSKVGHRTMCRIAESRRATNRMTELDLEWISEDNRRMGLDSVIATPGQAACVDPC